MLLFLIILLWMHSDSKSHSKMLYEKSRQDIPLMNEKMQLLRSPRCFFTECPSYSRCEYRWGNAQRCESFRQKYAEWEYNRSQKLLQGQIDSLQLPSEIELPRKDVTTKTFCQAIPAPSKEQLLKKEYEAIQDQIEVY